MAYALTDYAGDTPRRGTLPMAANTIINKGEIVQVNGSNLAIPGAAANGFKAVGIAKQTYDNRTGSEAGGAAGALEVEYECGIFGVGGSAGVNPGVKVYVAGPNSVTSTVGSNGIAGICTETLRNGKYWCLISPVAGV